MSTRQIVARSLVVIVLLGGVTFGVVFFGLLGLIFVALIAFLVISVAYQLRRQSGQFDH